MIPGDDASSLDTQSTQPGDGVPGRRSDLVADTEDAYRFLVLEHDQRSGPTLLDSFQRLPEGHGYGDAPASQVDTPDLDSRTIDLGTHPQADFGDHVFGFDQLDPGLLSGHQDGPRQGVCAVLLHARRPLQHQITVNTFARHNLVHGRLALRQSACLVEQDSMSSSHGLEEDAALHQDSCPGRSADGGDDGGRCGQNQRAGTTDDENRDRAIHLTGHKPRDAGSCEDRGREPTRISVHRANRLGTLLLGLCHQLDNLPERRVLPDFGRDDLDDAVLVERAGEHLVSHGSLHRNGFPGHGRLVHRCHALGDRAVHGRPLPRLHENPVPNPNVLDADLHHHVFPHDVGLVRRNPHQCRHCLPCRIAGGLLDECPEYHHEADHRGGKEFASQQAGNDSDGHQFVHIDTSLQEPFQGPPDDRSPVDRDGRHSKSRPDR